MFMLNPFVQFPAAGGGGETAVLWNSADKHANVTLSNGDLTATAAASGTPAAVRATKFVSSGKYYVEFLIGTFPNNSTFVGLLVSGEGLSQFGTGFASPSSVIWERGSGNVYIHTTSPAFATGSWAANDVLGIAIDITASRLYFRQNGTWLDGGDPDAGTGGRAFTPSTFAAVCAPYGTSVTLRSTSAQFTGSIPTGYVSLAAV